LFTVQWVHFSPDQGWGAWLAGSTVMVLGGLLLRKPALPGRAAAGGTGPGWRRRPGPKSATASSRDLHDVIAHSLTVSLLHVM